MLAFFLAPIYILINFYVVRWMILWMGSCNYLFRSLPFRITFIILYIFLSSSLLTGFLIKKPLVLRRFFKKTGNYFLGTFMYILMVILFVDVGRLILKYAFHVNWIYTPQAFVLTGFFSMLLILSLSIHGILQAQRLKISYYEVDVSKEVPDISQLKVALVADIHLGYGVDHFHVRQIVRKINEINPDLVCIAGDIFDNEYDAIQSPEKIKKELRSIHSTYGTFACWGNHDLNEPILAGFTFSKMTTEYKDPRMYQFLKDANILLLNDESILIDDKFYLVGRKDISRAKKIENGRKTPAQLTKKLNRSKPIILMDHQPKELQEIANAGVDLNLCGHTHDGQVFPGNLILPLIWENSRGYLKKDSMHNIVTSGAGIWGPSMRIGTANEICSITIHFQ